MTCSKLGLVAVLLGASSLLSGCAAGLALGVGAVATYEDDETDSRFIQVTGNEINVAINNEINGTVESADVGLVAYASGIDYGRNVAVAYSGMRDGADVGAPVTSGTATYDATYGYTGVDNVDDEVYVGLTGTQFEASARGITLDADFDAGTLTGTTADLDVDGAISGSTLSGAVHVDYALTGGSSGRLSTTLDGRIGETGVIGAFHGHDEDTAIAGGFVGTRN